MRQLYDAYAARGKVSALLTQLPWTHLHWPSIAASAVRPVNDVWAESKTVVAQQLVAAMRKATQRTSVVTHQLPGDTRPNIYDVLKHDITVIDAANRLQIAEPGQPLASIKEQESDDAEVRPAVGVGVAFVSVFTFSVAVTTQKKADAFLLVGVSPPDLASVVW